MNEGKRMIFVDGENLVFRYQEMLESGRLPVREVIHIKNVFVWHPRLTQLSFMNLIRVSYYSSMVGDSEKLDDIRQQIAFIPVQYSTVMDSDNTAICPYIYKKEKQSQKTRYVDINLTIDVMRTAYGDAADCIHILSGDGDYIPVINEVMRQGKKVIVWAFSSGVNKQLTYTPDEFKYLDDIFFINPDATLVTNQTSLPQ